MITAEEVHGLLALLEGVGARPWVDGGWGVDALLGRQGRVHADLDVVVDAGDVERARSALEAAGFAVLRDWLPTALALRHPDGREVDLHPVLPTADGGGDQLLPPPDPPFHYGPPALGRIGGCPVRCVDAGTQLRAHTGYPPDALDHVDVRALAAASGLELPAGYGPQPLDGSEPVDVLRPPFAVASDGVVVLHCLREQDAPAHHAAEDDESVRWLTGGRRSDPARVSSWVLENQAAWLRGGPRRHLGVFDARTSALLGGVEAHLGSDDDAPVSVSYAVAPPSRGRGLATRAVRLLCGWLAEAAPGRAVVLRVAPGNAASHRVARAVGAVERDPDGADDGLVRYDLDPAEVRGCMITRVGTEGAAVSVRGPRVVA